MRVQCVKAVSTAIQQQRWLVPGMQSGEPAILLAATDYA
jgi:hypothetical protein